LDTHTSQVSLIKAVNRAVFTSSYILLHERNTVKT